MTIFASTVRAIAAAGIFSAPPAYSQNIQSDGTFTVLHDDVHIAEAIRQARARLPEFLELARKPDPSMHTFAVKLAIPTNHGAEFIWLAPFQRKSDHFVGRVSNEPRNIKGIKQGQWVKFESDNIIDWTYHQNGKRKGNFTARAVAKQLPPVEAEKFIREFNLDREP